jgi:hypothetical protein
MTKQTTTPPVATLQQHAHDLARAFKARVIESAQLQPHEAFAAPHLRLVVAAAIVDTTTYAVVLHELGHLAAPTGALPAGTGGDRRALTRVEEDAAWTWARHYALVWTPEMEVVATWAEGTYQPPTPPPATAAPAAPVAPKTPTPDRIDWTKYR